MEKERKTKLCFDTVFRLDKGQQICFVWLQQAKGKNQEDSEWIKAGLLTTAHAAEYFKHFSRSCALFCGCAKN